MLATIALSFMLWLLLGLAGSYALGSFIRVGAAEPQTRATHRRGRAPGAPARPEATPAIATVGRTASARYANTRA